MSTPPSPWQRRARARRAAKQPLSLESIVAVAMELFVSDGLAAVSMRRVAQQLDTGAASLYVYVRNRDELHALILDEVIGDITVPDPEPGRWREQIAEFAREQLRVFAGYPGIAQIVMRNPAPTGPNALRVTEKLLAILRGAELAEQAVAWALDLINLYVAAVAMERTVFFGAEADLAERMRQVEHHYAELSERDFPNLVAMRTALMVGDDDDRFEFGLTVLLNGVAACTPDREL